MCILLNIFILFTQIPTNLGAPPGCTRILNVKKKEERDCYVKKDIRLKDDKKTTTEDSGRRQQIYVNKENYSSKIPVREYVRSQVGIIVINNGKTRSN